MTTAHVRSRIASRSHGDAQSWRFQVRAEQIRSANEYAQLMDRGMDRVCVCGRTRGEHDIAPDFTQPCVESGCKDFTDREMKGSTGKSMEAPTADRLINNLKEIASEKDALRGHLLAQRKEIDEALKLLGIEEAPAKAKRGRPNGSKNKKQEGVAA